MREGFQVVSNFRDQVPPTSVLFSQHLGIDILYFILVRFFSKLCCVCLLLIPFMTWQLLFFLCVFHLPYAFKSSSPNHVSFSSLFTSTYDSFCNIPSFYFQYALVPEMNCSIVWLVRSTLSSSGPSPYQLIV